MKEFFASVFAALGMGAATFGSEASLVVIFDEEETPKSLIK